MKNVTFKRRQKAESGKAVSKIFGAGFGQKLIRNLSLHCGAKKPRKL